MKVRLLNSKDDKFYIQELDFDTRNELDDWWGDEILAKADLYTVIDKRIFFALIDGRDLLIMFEED